LRTQKVMVKKEEAERKPENFIPGEGEKPFPKSKKRIPMASEKSAGLRKAQRKKVRQAHLSRRAP